MGASSFQVPNTCLPNHGIVIVLRNLLRGLFFFFLQTFPPTRLAPASPPLGRQVAYCS